MTLQAEYLANIMEENGIEVPFDKIDVIAKEFADALQMDREAEAVPFFGSAPKCQECESLKKQLKSAQVERDTYKQSISSKLGNKPVWIDGKEVMYDPR